MLNQKFQLFVLKIEKKVILYKLQFLYFPLCNLLIFLSYIRGKIITEARIPPPLLLAAFSPTQRQKPSTRERGRGGVQIQLSFLIKDSIYIFKWFMNFFFHLSGALKVGHFKSFSNFSFQIWAFSKIDSNYFLRKVRIAL